MCNLHPRPNDIPFLPVESLEYVYWPFWSWAQELQTMGTAGQPQKYLPIPEYSNLVLSEWSGSQFLASYEDKLEPEKGCFQMPNKCKNIKII
jgi:hypothetical protein